MPLIYHGLYTRTLDFFWASQQSNDRCLTGLPSKPAKPELSKRSSAFRASAANCLVAAALFLASLQTIVSIRRAECLSRNSSDLKDWSSALRHTSNSNKNRYRFTAAICTIVRDHEAYLTEWIDYHLLGLNFENIYLYDNSDDFDLERWSNNTRDHQIYSRVVVAHRPGQGWLDDEDQFVQEWVYNDCVWKYGQGFQAGKSGEYEDKWKESPLHDYMALIDADEFLVLQTYPERHSTIHDLLNEYLVPFGGALVINWMLIGSANRSIYSPVPVLKRFQYRDRETHSVVKTIVKSEDFVRVKNPHAVNVRKNTAVHDTVRPGNFQRISSKTAASNHNKPSNVVLLYHFRYMSTKENVLQRCVRGEIDDGHRKCLKRGEAPTDDMPDHFVSRPGKVFDDKAWTFLTSKVSKYRAFDYPEWEDFT